MCKLASESHEYLPISSRFNASLINLRSKALLGFASLVSRCRLSWTDRLKKQLFTRVLAAFAAAVSLE